MEYFLIEKLFQRRKQYVNLYSTTSSPYQTGLMSSTELNEIDNLYYDNIRVQSTNCSIIINWDYKIV